MIGQDLVLESGTGRDCSSRQGGVESLAKLEGNLAGAGKLHCVAWTCEVTGFITPVA